MGNTTSTAAARFSGSAAKSHRRARGLSATKVAVEIGVTESAVHKYEAGVAVPTVPRLAALAAALNVEIGALFEGPAVAR